MDATLLYRLNAKDEKAFREIFDMWYEKIKGWLHKKGIEDQDIITELISDGFIGLYKHLQKGAKLDSIYHAKSVVYKTVIWRMNHLPIRRKRDLLVCVESLEPYDGGVEQRLFDNAIVMVRRSIETLPGVCKQVFEMWAFEDMSYVEIAQEMDLSPQTVRNQKTRAIKLIRERLNIKV